MNIKLSDKQKEVIKLMRKGWLCQPFFKMLNHGRKFPFILYDDKGNWKEYPHGVIIDLLYTEESISIYINGGNISDVKPLFLEQLTGTQSYKLTELGKTIEVEAKDLLNELNK